ncbi:MAG: acetylornithine deacetylase [Pseudoxanthomonas sp.]|nr:acetylornithine deacetylase [Pseudoxanthomonas sp.]
MIQDVLTHLEALVSFDTRNPPRAIGTDGIFDYLRAHLPGFTVTVTDHGAGAVSLLAVRGTPKRVFNVHLDTVPSSPAWTADPHVLRVTDDRAIALGACDIKGAAACLLAAASRTTGDAAFLFTSDEEANDARCIAAFLASDHGFTEAIVAEPTMGEAVLAHRGISSVLMQFTGQAGHASGQQARTASALHAAIRWGDRALDHVESLDHVRFGGLTGLRFNIGRVEGGIKANMIAPRAELRFGFRPLPSQSPDDLHARFRSFADPSALASYEETFSGPSLPAGDIAGAEARRLAARDLADELGLPIGNAVDFWTEASLFSAAGLTTFVYGPGDIAQAHTADEWVSLDQLATVATAYRRLLEAS